MAVNLSALAGAGQQFFDDDGVILSGGKLYSYAAGTTTPQTTYTSVSGSTAHTNPIVLNSAGRIATGEIWLTAGSNYKFALYTSTDVLITTWDNITGINGTGITSNASNVTYDPAGTGAVSTTVQTKLRETVSVLDFGADPTGSADSATAFSNAISQGGLVFIPEGTYIFNSGVTISNPVTLIGSGQGSTFLHRNYSPGVSTSFDALGIFQIVDGGSLVSMRDMTLRSLSGQTGGCLLSIVNTNAQAIGQMTFTNMGFTTTGSSTHQYTIYMDGTARTSAPIGIRGVDMFGCSVFGGGISTILAKGVLKWSFIGGGCYPAGGVAGSNVRISGSAAVPTQSFQFLPADCACPISFDYAELGIFACGVMGAVTNTANTENIYGYGFTGSLQQNWGNSAFFDTSTGLAMTVNQKISNTGVATNFALEMIGSITGFQKNGTVTKIGQTGVSYSTVCPDTQTFSFINQSGKLFSISTGGGASALVFADYKSATITLLSNPSTEFQASATPGAGLTGIFKSVNSHQISVKNNTGAPVTYDVLNFGNVSSTTDPA